MKIHWGAGLVIVFIVFVDAVLAVVGFAMSRRVELVTDGYYEKGLGYQRQIDRIERSRRQGVVVTVDIVPEGLVLRFPGAPSEVTGVVLAYRPDDRSRDLTMPVGVDVEGRMLVPRAKLAEGVWRIKVTWSERGEEFYHEQKVEVR